MRIRHHGAALLAAAALLCAAPAQADNYPVRDGAGTQQTFAARLISGILYPIHLMYGMVSGTPTAVNMTVPGAFDVNIVGGSSGFANTTPSAQTITAADSASTSTTGQGSVAMFTGSPTVNSAASFAFSGQAAGTLTVTGTFSATGAIEASYDGGTTWTSASGLLRGTSQTTAAITGVGVFSIDLTSVTNLRVRATAYTSGTMTVKLTYSPASGLTKLLNGVKPVDSAGGDASDTTNHAWKVNCVTGCTGGGGAGAQAFQPDSFTPQVLSTSTTSTRSTVLGSGTTLRIGNPGPGTAFINYSASSSVTAATTNIPIYAGTRCYYYFPGGSAFVAGILASGAGQLVVDSGGGGASGCEIFTDVTGASSVKGTTASGSAASDPPVVSGGRAATTSPAAVSDGQVAYAQLTKRGRTVTAPYALDEITQRGAASSTAGTAQAFTGWSTPAASTSFYIVSVQCFRTDAGTSMIYATLNDSASTKVPIPAGSGAAPPFPVPLKAASAATAPTFTPSTATSTVFCNAQGFNE